MTTAVAGRVARRAGRVRHGLGRFWAGISAITTKELRSRMRGRRAFVVVTVYLLLLSLFAFGIYAYLKQQATLNGIDTTGFPGGGREFFPSQPMNSNTALSANIGHGIFGGLLMIETLLVVVLAPAFTSGAISLEREKQTIDMLVTTPLSTLGMVIGKLFSSLIYVFLLIVASIPLASVVFVFGGVGPEDLVRGYVLLFALAFGMGAIGLFISALVRRTQTAIVATFIAVLVLSMGSIGIHEFLKVATRPAPSSGFVVAQRPHTAPEALLWLNPFVADLDLVCTTAPGAYHRACEYMSSVTGKPYFGSNPDQPQPFGVDDAVETLPGGAGADGAMPGKGAPPPVDAAPPVEVAPPPAEVAPPADANGCPGEALCDGFLRGDEGKPPIDAEEDVLPGPVPEQQVLSLGYPRDTFWPKSAAAFVVLGVALTLLSAQLVSPTRRLRLPRIGLRRPPKDQPPGEPSTEPSSEAMA